MTNPASFPNARESQAAGWFSRRHQTSAVSRAAQQARVDRLDASKAAAQARSAAGEARRVAEVPKGPGPATPLAHDKAKIARRAAKVG